MTLLFVENTIGGAKRSSEFKPVDLHTLLADAADLYKLIAEDRRIELVVDHPLARGPRVQAALLQLE